MAADTPADTSQPPTRFLNRQLSWHEFNRRVLALAEDPSLPYADRMRFVSIWANNLDEYFLVRVASMKDDAQNGRRRAVDDGFSSETQFSSSIEMITEQHKAAQRLTTQLRGEMATADQTLAIVGWDDLTEAEQHELTEFYLDQVFPVLTPLAFDPGHPFPYISTLSLNLGLLIVDPATDVRRFARVKVPQGLLGRHVWIGDRAVPLEAVISANLDQLFPGVEILERTVFRVTRNADISVSAETLDDHDDDLLTAVESELRRRRFGEVVRLEIQADASAEMRGVLQTELAIEDDVFFDVAGPIDLGTFCNIDKLVGHRPSYTLDGLPQRTPEAFAGVGSSDELFARIRAGDVLVHHPYDSFGRGVGPCRRGWQAGRRRC